jgi:hypothetical protein
MQNPVEIENIEEMRRQEGIDDVELEGAIRGLQVGDTVKLTFLCGTGSLSKETVPVRITGIAGGALRGELVREPTCAALAHFAVGSPVAFTAAHVHSVVPKDVGRRLGRTCRGRRKPVPKK